MTPVFAQISGLAKTIARSSVSLLRQMLLLLLACELKAAALIAPTAASPPPTQPTPDPIVIVLDHKKERAAKTIQSLVVEGVLSFTPGEIQAALAEQIGELEENGVDGAHADDTAYYLGLFYRRYGYSQTEVNYHILGNSLRLQVTEGTRTILRTLRFEGQKQIPIDTLFEYMIGATPDKMAQYPEVFPFILSEIRAGVTRVRGLYESLGFLDTTVDEALIEISSDRRGASVVVRIQEGPCYRIGQISLPGAPFLSQADLLREAQSVNPEAVYHPERLALMQRALKFFLNRQGYFDAEVLISSPSPDATTADVPVTFQLVPGPLYRFSGITLEGLDRLSPKFLQRRIASLQGEIYSPSKLEEKYRELIRTGLFRSIRIEPVRGKHNTILLKTSIEEARAREIGFSFGAGTYEGASAGIRLSDRDFFGFGRPLSLDLNLSQRTRRGEIIWNDPWFLDTRLTFRGRAYVQTREEPGYSKTESGARLDLGRLFGEEVDATLFTQVKHVSVESLGIPLSFLGNNNYELGTVGLSQSIDHRDSPTNPTKGWILSSTLDANSVGGSASFSRATARLSFYRPIGRSLNLSLGARTGLLFSSNDVPIDERFFLGGATTVRSFQERRMGPSDGLGHPVGGEAFTLLNAELSFPLPKSVEGVAFIDAGNLVQKVGDLNWDDTRFGLGLGLRYRLPIGPLRLDAAINPAPRTGEPTGAFHFTFGAAF
jgi:outer membrane protein insertion porin family